MMDGMSNSGSKKTMSQECYDSSTFRWLDSIRTVVRAACWDCTATFCKLEICRNGWCANIVPPWNEAVSVLLQWFLFSNKNDDVDKIAMGETSWHKIIHGRRISRCWRWALKNTCVTKGFQFFLSWKVDPMTMVLGFMDICWELDSCQSSCNDSWNSWTLALSWV